MKEEKYVVTTWSPTGSCWVTYLAAFNTKKEAIEYAENNGGGQIIRTDFYKKVDAKK